MNSTDGVQPIKGLSVHRIRLPDTNVDDLYVTMFLTIQLFSFHFPTAFFFPFLTCIRRPVLGPLHAARLYAQGKQTH